MTHDDLLSVQNGINVNRIRGNKDGTRCLMVLRMYDSLFNFGNLSVRVISRCVVESSHFDLLCKLLIKSKDKNLMKIFFTVKVIKY